ncbi:MAG: tetratricopeptide repeat protein, partial [Xanthomonadales bacterium]|nr:tetratricopeptide repeat protein [Xanthomonadales bacterium]
GTTASNLRGDLDAVLLKCLRKEPGKRYRGAAELADDLEAFLDGRPVSASAGSTRYALGKFVARHRVLVASATVVFAVLVVALALTNRQLEETRSQRDLAAQERDRAEAVTEYLVDVFEQATPLRHGGREPTVREALESGAKQLEQDRRLPEETRGVIETAMASVLQDLGDYDTAISIAQRAVARFELQAVRDPRRYAEALARRGSLRQEKGRYAEAAADFRLAIIALGRADPTATASLLNNLATVAMDRDRPEEGDRYRKRAMKLLLVLAGSETLEQAAKEVPSGEVAELMAVVAHNECGVLEMGGHYAEALRVCEATVTLKRRLFPESPARWQGTLSVIGNVHSGRGDYAAAARAHGEALEISERVFGPRHPQVAIASLNLGVDLRQLGDIAGARDAYQKAASIFTGSQGPEHRYTLIARNNLANLEIDAGNFAEGLAEHRAIMEIRRRVLGADAPELAQSLSNIANALSALGDESGAVAANREALRILQRVRSSDHPDLGYARLDLAQRLVSRGQYEEALALLESAHACFAGTGDNALARAQIDFLRAQARIDQAGQREISIALARSALAVAQAQPDNDRIDPVEVQAWLEKHGAAFGP